MGDDRIVILTQRSVYDLMFRAMALIAKISRAIISPGEAIVFISLRRPSVFAAADRRRRVPPRNALEVRSGQDPPRGFINTILLRPCTSAQFAARSLGSALLWKWKKKKKRVVSMGSFPCGTGGIRTNLFLSSVRRKKKSMNTEIGRVVSVAKILGMIGVTISPARSTRLTLW